MVGLQIRPNERRGFLFAALSLQRITRIFTYLILKEKLSVEIREIRGG